MNSSVEVPHRELSSPDVSPRDQRAADVRPTTIEPQFVGPPAPLPAPADVSVPKDGPAICRDWSNRHDRYEMIAEAAYFRAERRGFGLGNEEIDWLEAEQELIERLEGDHPSSED